MPVRTINYTNRKRIRREDARITLREKKGEFFFDAGLNLSNYELSPESQVFVEAYRQTKYMRFNFGLAASIKAPADRSLRDFGSPEGIHFRVKVVTDNVPQGMLLAEADQITPRKADEEDQSIIPLLPVVGNDSMGDEIWRINFDVDQTHLFVNSTFGDWRAMARDEAFISLVYPVVLRTILNRILFREDHRDPEDMDDWRARWLRFSLDLPGVSDLPEGKDEDQLDDWIDSAVSGFCQRLKIRATYELHWKGVQER